MAQVGFQIVLGPYAHIVEDCSIAEVALNLPQQIGHRCQGTQTDPRSLVGQVRSPGEDEAAAGGMARDDEIALCSFAHAPARQFGAHRFDGRGDIVEQERLPAEASILDGRDEHSRLGQRPSQRSGMGQVGAGAEVASVDEDYRRRGGRRVTIDLDELLGGVPVGVSEGRSHVGPGGGEFGNAHGLDAHPSVPRGAFTSPVPPV